MYGELWSCSIDPSIVCIWLHVVPCELLFNIELVTPVAEWVFCKLFTIITDYDTWDSEIARDVVPENFENIVSSDSS
ncbi:hypothetical protein Tco_1404205 [Tanacetum coccineum]